MEEKTITFKNSSRMAVVESIAEILAQRILSGNANDMQVFHDENKKLICIIRLSDISFIR